eukprot:TRINITY_DN60248_c0_g1_i1.p1 TRINITY_DN60248_c0_g1~~TRINITY_DN60248_c0_g1_i1.p1  ORF type:complete len:788 (+),score=119.88 TRINITY_DN60248_c0_g1_i1:252-2615(+)
MAGEKLDGKKKKYSKRKAPSSLENPDAGCTSATPAQILEALSWLGKRPEIAAVVLAPLTDALVACVKALVQALELYGSGEASSKAGVATAHIRLSTERAICFVLGKLFQESAAKWVCTDYREQCAQVLANAIARHPKEHEVQVNGQWAHAQLVGIVPTLHVVQPLFNQSLVVVQAFMWTAAEAKETLTWEVKEMLVRNALQLMSESQCAEDVDTQRRCLELIGAQMSADSLGVRDRDAATAAKVKLAAESVPVLVDRITRWGSADTWFLTEKATEALWRICRGSFAEPVMNHAAHHRLCELEHASKSLDHVLCLLVPIDLKGDLAAYLLDILASINGLSYLCTLLCTQPEAAHAGHVNGLQSEDLKWAVLKATKNLQDFDAKDAAQLLQAILGSLQDSPSPGLIELASQALTVLLQGMQSQLPARGGEDNILLALRSAADNMLRFILRFQQAKDGRWPSKSATALRSIALADNMSRQSLAASEQLQGALKTRIEGACERHDKHTYSELESTFRLASTVWGINHILQMFQGVLEGGPNRLRKQARRDFIRATCRVVAESEDLTVPDALCVVASVLQAKEVLCSLQETEQETLASMASALGHAVGVLGREDASKSDQTLHQVDLAARAMCFFLNSVVSASTMSDLNAVILGVCAAAAGGRIPCSALNAAGASEIMAGIAEKLVCLELNSGGHYEKNGKPALADALECLSRLRGGCYLTILKAMDTGNESTAIQVACLRAALNLIGDRIPPECGAREALLAACHQIVKHRGDQDECLRASADRVCGLLQS